MFLLEYYFSKNKISSQEITPEHTIVMLGSGDCAYSFNYDANLAQTHLMICVQNGKVQICPLAYVKYGETVLDLNQWFYVDPDVELILSNDSVVIFREQAIHKTTSSFNSIEQPKTTSSVNTMEQPKTTSNVNSMTQPKTASNVNSMTQLKTTSRLNAMVRPKTTGSFNAMVRPKTTDSVNAMARSKENIPNRTQTMQIQKPENDLQIAGKRIGTRYEIHKKIGEGAMGAIYEAFDQELLRTVALKILVHQDIASTEGKRFLQEAQTIVKLQHPNIIHVYDIREFQGHPFFTMDLIEGQTLEDVIKNNEYSLRDAMQWIRDIAYALDCAHQSGIIHRDVKPSNIMLDHGTPILMDFGIARDLESNATRLTTTGETLGTPTYMSPEQAQGDNNNVGAWTDVYGLGAVLYELLAKHPPFEGTPIDILQKVCNIDPVSIRKYNPDIPHDALIIVKKAMFKERQYRYQSIKEMGDDIQQFLDEKPLTTKMPSPLLYIKRIIKNNKLLFIIAASILVLVTSIFSYGIINNYNEKQRNYELIKSNLKQTIAQHLKIKEESNTNTFLISKAVKLSEEYTRYLTQGISNNIIFPYKVDINILIIKALIESNQFDLAEAYLGLLEEDTKNIPTIILDNTIVNNRIVNNGIKYTSEGIKNSIKLTQSRLQEKRQEEEKAQINNSLQILKIIPEKCEQELINDFAFSLLVYQDNMLALKKLKDYLNNQSESDTNFIRITDTIINVLDRLEEFIKKRQGSKQVIQGLTPQEEYVFQLLSYTSEYLNTKLLKNIQNHQNYNLNTEDEEQNDSEDEEQNDSENDSENENQLADNNSNIRIFCTHVLGLSHFSSSSDTEKAIKTLIKAIKTSKEQKFIDVAIKALISLDKRPIKQTRLFQEVNNHENLLEKLSSHWAINILLTLLENKPYIEKFIIQHHLDAVEQIIAQYDHVMNQAYEKNYTDDYRHSLCRIIAHTKTAHSINTLLNAFKNIDAKSHENEKIFMLKLFLDYNFEDEKIIKVLLNELADSNTSATIQKYIIQIVGKVPNIDIIKRLLEFLSDKNQSIQNTTLEVLMQMPSNLKFVVHQYLTEHQLLSSETKLLFYILLTSLKDTEYCESLIDIINSVRADKIELILKALANLEEYAIREFNKIYKTKNSIQKLYILRSVAYMKSNAAFEFLIKQYQQTKEFTIKEFILESLVSWPQLAEPFLISVLATSGNRLGTKAGITLSQIGNKTIPAVCMILQDIIKSNNDHSNDKEEKNTFEESQDLNLINTLSAFGDEIRSHIIPYLNPSCPRVMIIVINTLKNLKNEQDIPLLLDIFNVITNATNSEQSKIIKATKDALVELGSIGTPTIVKALDALNDTKDPQNEIKNKRLQSIYLEILGRMKNKEILPKLYEFLKDPELYKNIALALSAYHLQILPDMLQLLEEEENYKGVWEYLRYLKREIVYPELESMINDKHSSNLVPYIPLALCAYIKNPKTINDLLNILQNQKLGNTSIGNSQNLIKNVWKGIAFYPIDTAIKKLIPLLKVNISEKQYFFEFCASNFAKVSSYLVQEIKKNPQNREILSSIRLICDKLDPNKKDKIIKDWGKRIVYALSSASPEATEILLQILQNDIGLRQIGVKPTKERKNPNYDAHLTSVLQGVAKKYKNIKKVVDSGLQKRIEGYVHTIIK